MKVRQLYSPREMMRRGLAFAITDARALRIVHSRTLPEAGEPERDVYFVIQPRPDGVGTEPVTGFFSREEAERFIRAARSTEA